MAQQIFKGFKQVLEGYNSFETGFLYFVRTNSTDGYLQFNGKKYGTAEDVAVMLGNKIGTLPSGYTNVVDYVNAMVGEGVDELNATVTGESNGVRVEIVEEAGKLTGVTVTAPDFANAYASKSAFETVSGMVETINGDYLKASDKTELNNAITAETAARESADNALDTRLGALEAISGQSHTHENKAVLDGITAKKVTAWDNAEQNAKTYADNKVADLDATVTGESHGVTVQIAEVNGKLTGVTVAAPDFDNTYAPKAAFEAVSGQSHTHANKALLDSYTQTEANLADAVNKKHTHANQATLDDITAAYTTEEKAKLANIAEGAEVNVQADWNEADSTSDAFILNKPENLVQDANYVHTDNNYTAQEKTKLEEVEAGAQVNVIETVKVNGTALTVSDKAVDVVIPAAAEYTIVKRDEAEQGYLATYALTKDGTQVGASINIPKDFLVRSAEVKTVTTADDPYQGASVDDKYIDFVINTSGATTGGDHIYLPVNELVDVYTKGDGIDVADNKISVQIDSGNANGLSAGSNGVALALATDATTGAMSSADHAKLTRLDASAATKTEVGTLSSRVDTLEAISASADTRLNALEALTASTNSALQSISAGDASVNVGTKDASKNQTVAVARSQAADNALELKNDGIYVAPIYYWEEEQQG